MSQNRRIQKVSSLLKKEISLILNNDLEDNLIAGNFISITKIEISPDLHYCKIYVTCSVEEEKQNQLMESLNNSRSFIRHKLSQRVEMRRVPELTFKIDKTLEQGTAVLKVLDMLREEKK